MRSGSDDSITQPKRLSFSAAIATSVSAAALWVRPNSLCFPLGAVCAARFKATSYSCLGFPFGAVYTARFLKQPPPAALAFLLARLAPLDLRQLPPVA
jgi:hypothetical protein